MSKWNSRKNGFPPSGVDVLFYLGPNSVRRYVLGTWQTGNGFTDLNGRYLRTVTHWMFIPNPPKTIEGK